MRYMNKLTLIASLIFLATALHGQNSNEQELSLEQEFDKLVQEWESLSAELSTYSGLKSYCTIDAYKANVINTLGIIHHYDSLVLEIITDPTEVALLDDKEQKATLKEIEKFESEYSTTAFMVKLQEECKFRRDIEHDKKYSVNDIGANSYDGQILLLETDLRKYIKHIDSRVEHIDQHVHKLHIDAVRSYNKSE